MINAVPSGWRRRGLGWKQPRHRDVEHRMLAARLDARKLVLPPAAAAADCKRLVLDVLDQGGLGSCVWNAITQLIRMNRVRQGEISPELAARLAGYIQTLWFEGALADNGCDPLDAFQLLTLFGFCRESRMPYSEATFARYVAEQKRLDPEIERFMFDQRHKSNLDYARVTGATTGDKLDQIKRLITAGYAVTWGGPVTNAFCEGAFDPSKPLAYPTRDVAGGHEMLVVGYDAVSPIVLNSWSPDFGLGGYVRFTWDYVLSDDETETVLEAPGFSEPPLAEAA